MKVNVKKPLRQVNRTKYFSPDHCRSHVVFSSPSSYQSRNIKIEGYESRLYWQFRYCEDYNGQTFYYTLTYNDEHLPKYYGVNCFDYEDLRDLLTGGFRKQLLRKYGTTFKYFVGAELGDGKGVRGMANNPHYHILFFLEDALNSQFPYKPITSEDFRHLVRLYWQGFDQDVDGFHDFRQCRYGIAKEGENVGKVTDFRACMYCAKYVTKDVKLKRKEHYIEKRLRLDYRSNGPFDEEFAERFYYGTIYSAFNTPLDAKHTKWVYSSNELLQKLVPERIAKYLEVFPSADLTKEDYLEKGCGNYMSVVCDICRKNSFWTEFWQEYNQFITEKVNIALTEYRNRYCNKCRISHGVGDYALQQEGFDKLNPSIPIPDKKDGWKYRPISMYYYRKLYTDVHIDEKGSPIRVLNPDGVRYKFAHLNERLDKKYNSARSDFEVVLQNPELFDKMRSSDVNVKVTTSYNGMLTLLNRLQEDFSIDEIFKRYARYKLIYEDRFLPYSSMADSRFSADASLDYEADYLCFISSVCISRSDLRLSVFIEDGFRDYLPYSSHPYFLRLIGFFDILDLFSDYFFLHEDNRKQKKAEEIAAVKRFHSKRKLEEFYSTFK